MVIMQLEGDILGSYMQCHFAPDACRNYVVMGDEGRLENIRDGPEDPIFVWKRRVDGFRMIGDEVYRGEPIDPSGGHGGADQTIVAEFMEFVRNGGPTTATPEAARMSVATGYQATMSMRAGGTPMDVPPIDWQGTAKPEPVARRGAPRRPASGKRRA